MLTYTQAYKRAADMTGISTTTSTVALTNIKQDINQGLRIFKNAARRYTTRKEVKTDLIAGQQYYTFPEDMVRITTVKVSSGSLTLPITIVDSERVWNEINLIPAMTVGIPTRGFIKGRNELGLYPIPSATYVGGLIVSYEPRLRDMSLEDTTATVNVTNGQAIVTAATSMFTANMVGQWLSVTDGSDGYWYQITGYTDPTHITLENVYQDATETGATAIIGQVPDIPEDYHMALVYYAAFNYFLKRKDDNQSATYNSMFQELLKEYKSVYSSRTTGVTQDDLGDLQYNLFNLPPNNVSA